MGFHAGSREEIGIGGSEMGRLNVGVLCMLMVIWFGLVGCFNTESHDNSVSHNYNTTLGQELVDLKAAHDKEAISEDEYNRLKKALTERRTK
jgi:hypothetical protein